MSYREVRTALASRLEAVDGVGRVSPYFRWTATAPGLTPFNQMFVSDGILNAWMIRRVSRGDEKTGGDDTRYKVQHAIEISAFYALAESDPGQTEEAFQDLVDLVVDDLRDGDRTLGSIALTHTDPEARIQHAGFCGATCHAATIQITVEEIVTPMNDELLLLPSAARTADTSTEEQTNRGGRGLAILLSVTAAASGQINAIKVQVKDAGGTWHDLYTFGSLTINSTGFHPFVIYPAELGEEEWDASIVGVLPYRYRIHVDHANNIDSITYSLIAQHLR